MAEGVSTLFGDIRSSQEALTRQTAATLENERMLADVLEALPVGVTVERDGVVVRSNPLSGGISRPGPGTIREDDRTLLVDKNRISSKGVTITVTSDVTALEKARRRLEEMKDGLAQAVAERTAELTAANRELVKADKEKTMFISAASHELRTPLTSVIGFLNLSDRRFRKKILPLIDAPGKADTDKFLNGLSVASAEAKRLSRLVDDLLDMSKIGDGAMQWSDTDFDAGDLLRETACLFEDSRVPLCLDIEDTVVRGDRDRVKQVLLNLLSNAFKHTERGHVTLSVKPEGDRAAFLVEDTGIGIREEDRERIFDVFYQSMDENHRSSRKFGTGLGLSICKSIVERHGGTIKVVPGQDGGSRFVFDLPLA